MNIVPVSRGLAWFTGSLILFRSQFSRLLLIGLVLHLLMGASQAGVLGFLILLAIPALTAGIMQALFMAERGFKPPLMTLFCAFSSPGKITRLFLLGLVLIAIAMLTAGAILSGGIDALDPAMLARLEQGEIEALTLADPAVLERMVLALFAGLLISGTLSFFAVPLIWFQDKRAGAAVFSGLAGMIRNWAPFLVLSALLAVLALPVGLVSLALLAGAVGNSGMSTVLTLVMLLMLVAFQMVLFGTQYLSFKDVYGTGESDQKISGDDGQLVA